MTDSWIRAQMFDNETNVVCAIAMLRLYHHIVVLPPNTRKSARSRGQYCQRAPGLAEPLQRVSLQPSLLCLLWSLDASVVSDRHHTNARRGQGLYRLRQSTIGTSYGGVALQWHRLCGCVHEGAMARPWTGNGQFCSAINCNNRRKTCTALSFFRFPVKLLCM